MNSKMMILSGALLVSAACKGQETAPSVTLDQIPGHESLAQDTTHKESPRLVPAEAYIRTYLTLFGGLTALQTQTQLTAGGSGLFDTWTAYLGALGLPNYATDMSRNTQTNALMVASFERLGIALCDKALEKDLKSTPAVAVDKRLIYNFEVPATAVDAAGFADRFGILHRKFLGYPAKLAPTDRTARFFALYTDTIKKHNPTGSRFTAVDAGWAAVCQGLIRHPEFQLY